MHVAKVCQHIYVRDGLCREHVARIIMAGDGEVEHLPPRERVVDQMTVRPGPQGRGIPAQIFRHLLGRNHRPIGGMAGNARLAVGDHLLVPQAQFLINATSYGQRQTHDRVMKMWREEIEGEDVATQR